MRRTEPNKTLCAVQNAWQRLPPASAAQFDERLQGWRVPNFVYSFGVLGVSLRVFGADAVVFSGGDR